jgi:glutaredoxin
MRTMNKTTTVKSIATCALFLCASAGFSVQVQAQQLYRIVGPDGRVTFSDQAPPVAANAKVTAGQGGKFSNAGSTNTALPAELRAVATKFPVTLYTGKDCAPCITARNMLSTRGVPFTEKTVDTNDDIEALRRLFSEGVLPSATIGGQQLKGYSDQEWSQYLDAAGYPRTSLLPAGYRNAAAAPMVVKAAAPAPAAAAAPAAPAPAAAAAPEPANPAGIKF